jgi:hypothetical protein
MHLGNAGMIMVQNRASTEEEKTERSADETMQSKHAKR